jgi:hypothetical protein
MKIVQSKIVTAADLGVGIILNTHVNAAAAIDATKLDLSLTELQSAETAGTSILLALYQFAILFGGT